MPLEQVGDPADIPQTIRQLVENGIGLMDLVFLDQWIQRYSATHELDSSPADSQAARFISPSPAIDTLTVDNP